MGLVDPQTNLPTVSVILPVYNRAELVGRALASLREQDFDNPFEIIVIDDGSTDASAQVARDFDPRLTVLHCKHQRTHKARLAGARIARGELLAFLDSDDMAKPYHLSAHYQTFQQIPEAVLTYADCHHLKEARQENATGSRDECRLLKQPFQASFGLGGFIHGMNVMITRKQFLEHSRSLRDYWPAEDMALFLQVALTGPFAHIRNPTIIRDLRSDSVSVTQTAVQDGQCLLSMIHSWRNSRFYKDKSFEPLVRLVIERYWPSAFHDACRRRKLWLMYRLWRILKYHCTPELMERMRLQWSLVE